jgi:hypothetical protein
MIDGSHFSNGVLVHASFVVDQLQGFIDVPVLVIACSWLIESSKRTHDFLIDSSHFTNGLLVHSFLVADQLNCLIDAPAGGLDATALRYIGTVGRSFGRAIEECCRLVLVLYPFRSADVSSLIPVVGCSLLGRGII